MGKKKREKKFEIKVLHAELDQLWDMVDTLAERLEKLEQIKVLHAELDQLWDMVDTLAERLEKLEHPPVTVTIPPYVPTNTPLYPQTPYTWCQTDVDSTTSGVVGSE